MRNFEKIIINRPLGLILIFSVLGILTYYFGSFSLIGTTIVVVPLILITYFIADLDNFNIGIIFLLLGILSSIVYYEPQIPKQGFYDLRIIELNEKFALGMVNGRKVQIRNQSGQVFEYGEKLRVIGKFKSDINLEKGYVGHVFIKELINREQDFTYKIKNIPKKYYERLNEYFSDSESAFLNAILWGDKENMTYNQREFLADLGVIHLICISGFHIALLFSIIYKKLSFKLAIIVCFIYVLLVGASPSALRALFMIGILRFSKRLFKTYDPISSISFAATILILFKPYNIFNMGFLLSFGGTLGILLCYKRFLEGFYMLPPKINEYFSLGLSAQVFIYPILVLAFNKFSINFLISTFLVTPIIVVLLQLLLISIFLGGNLIWISVIPMKIIFVVFRGILVLLDNIAWFTPYLSPVFAIAYLIMLICIYMSIRGFYKFRIGVYLIIPLLILDIHILGTKVRVVQDKWNKGIVIECGFNKVALVNNNSEYFSKSIMRNEFVNEVIYITGDIEFEIDEDVLISIDDNFNSITLVSLKNDYDIIDLIQKKSAYIL